jgi:hypothetical protein
MNCCEPASFDSIFPSGNAQTVRFLLSKGCSTEQAEELSQQAWSNAWEKRHQFRGDSDLVSWVISIALNLLRMEWRRPKRELVEESALNFIGRWPQHDTKILVAQILAMVDSRTRQVLTDCYLTERVSRGGNSPLFNAVRKARAKVASRPTLIAAARMAAEVRN